MFERVSWRDHLASLNWAQGEHVMIVAPTGAGKSTLAQDLVQRRRHVVAFGTKPYDPTLKREYADWYKVREWDDIRPYMDRVMIWPKAEKTSAGTVAKQRRVFAESLDKIMVSRGWCVLVDETHYMTDPSFLGLRSPIALMHHVGRSSGISMVTLTQRPVWVPKIIYSSVSHAYIARTRDSDDLKRLSDLGGIDPKVLAREVSSLPSKWDYVYVNPAGDAPPAIVNRRR